MITTPINEKQTTVPKYRLIYFLACMFLFVDQSKAQEDNWDVYLAQYEKGVGSTMFNETLRDIAPLSSYTFLLKAGVKYTDCDKDGFPLNSDFSKLHVISDSIQKLIAVKYPFRHAGTFTYQCERIDYFYVRDTTNLSKTLEDLFKREFSTYKSLIEIRADSKWEA